MKTIDDIEVTNQRVLIRADLNAPMKQDASGAMQITDDGRLKASVTTINDLRNKKAKIIILAHLGRPKGERKPELSLKPIAKRLSELLNTPIQFIENLNDAKTLNVVNALQPGEVAMVENIRFEKDETSKNTSERIRLAQSLASLADVFVIDGFGVVHREQASVTDIARLLPKAAGRLVQAEQKAFAKVLNNPERPYVVVLGGSKVSDKLGVINNLINKVDKLLIGGGMAFTFLKAQGFEVGDSLLEIDRIDEVKQLMITAKEKNVEIVLPVDVVISAQLDGSAPVSVVDAQQIPVGQKGLDIGPKTGEIFASKINEAKTVVWNGPMGVFEVNAFAAGTKTVAQALANSNAYSVVGGGDSAAAIRLLGLDESRFDHISTGGGASLELLEGKVLPGLAVLEEE
ncbi:MAG: phosphoglycerate kinase [Candidatus Nanopelagicales bacterium]|jgi:phosphoglycerate kinase|nr:phosphoglycerate kinase [Candidatus Nanopelagicales bacterium]